MRHFPLEAEVPLPPKTIRYTSTGTSTFFSLFFPMGSSFSSSLFHTWA